MPANPLQEGDERIRTAVGVKPATSREKQGWVYLITDGGWAVKIGHARNPEKRLALLQTGTPEQLRILAVIDGPPRLERELHELFAGDRIRGEWFHKTRELVGYFEDTGFVCICRRGPNDECFIHGGDRASW